MTDKFQSESTLAFPGEVHQTSSGGVLVSKLDDVINWARSNSLWPLVFGTSCCAIEMMSAAAAKYDWSRFGFEVARATPRQADVIIISYTHLRAHETPEHLVCRLLLEKKKK